MRQCLKWSLLLLLLLPSLSSEAQQKFFFGRGYTAGVGSQVPYRIIRGGATTDTRPLMIFGGLTLGLDYNLYAFDDERSISLHASPTIALYSNIGAGPRSFLPVLGQSHFIGSFNFGNFSTPNSNRELGFGLGAGALLAYQFTNQLPRADGQTVFVGSNPSLMPSVRLSIRYWSKSDALTHVNLTASSFNQNLGGGSFRTVMLQLAVLTYLSY